jgi:hypothetical protein
MTAVVVTTWIVSSSKTGWILSLLMINNVEPLQLFSTTRSAVNNRSKRYTSNIGSLFLFIKLKRNNPKEEKGSIQEKKTDHDHLHGAKIRIDRLFTADRVVENSCNGSTLFIINSDRIHPVFDDDTIQVVTTTAVINPK